MRQSLQSLIEAEQARSGRSLREIARAIGVGDTTVWRWSRGLREPRRFLRGRLAAELHVTIDQLRDALEVSLEASAEEPR